MPPTRTAAEPRAGSQGGRRRGASILRVVVVTLVLLGAWEVVARVVLAGTFLLAAPTGMAQAIGDNAALYGRALGSTLGNAAQGFLWGNLAAVALAALVAVLPGLERVVLRVALVVYCLPLVAIGPLLRVVYGAGDGPQVTLAALAVYYTTMVPLLVGLRAIPSAWSDLVRSYGRGRWSTLVVVRLRASVPYLAAGLQVAVPGAALGALVGEFTGAERGLGILTIQALRSLDTNGLWALAAISAAVSVLGYVAVGWLGRRLSLDHPPILLAPPPQTGPRRTPVARAARSAAGAVLTAALVLLLWEGTLRVFALNPFFAKGPADVWAWLVGGPDAAAHRAEIFAALGDTAAVAVPGYVAGLALGVGLAAVFHLFPTVRRTATPIAVALRCVPIVAIAPLLIQALGRGPSGLVLVVALMTFFPTLVACAQGLRQAPGQVLDLFATFDAGRARVLRSAELPAMVPAFFAAARIAVPSAILGATVAEWLATGTGIGYLMALSAGANSYSTLWACVVVVTVVALAAYAVIGAVEQVVLRRVSPEQAGW